MNKDVLSPARLRRNRGPEELLKQHQVTGLQEGELKICPIYANLPTELQAAGT
jgi:hypothetical protein